MRTLSSRISIDLRRFAYHDVVCYEIDRMLMELPDANVIEIKLVAEES